MTIYLPNNAFIQVEDFFLTLQNEIKNRFAELEHKKFIIDNWSSNLGNGISCILENGEVFAKTGVNFSAITGDSLPAAATQKRPQLQGTTFKAFGISIVVHPQNPFVPTTHANLRFFCAILEKKISAWWFGGGFDLTPYYPFMEDCIHWHKMAKLACDPFGSDLYKQFKENCDQYFYLPHRQEARGIGGLFFDDYTGEGFAHSFGLVKNIGKHFLEAYLPIVLKRKDLAYGAREQAFQYYRRGRYVEFNLIYDRGTLFGLQSRGRTESILMSLPPNVTWQYNWQPEPNSWEAKLYSDYLPARDWI